MATAILAAGNFWGAEFLLGQVPGVTDTEVGHTGGHLDEPTYALVCKQDTGHAQAVRVAYDPGQIAYERLLEAFFAMHDPTQVDRQGPYVGSQYRSAIFFETPEEEAVALEVKRRLGDSGRFPAPIATQIVPAARFWRAEEHYQRFLEKSCGAFCRG